MGSQMLKTVGFLSFCVLQEGLPLGITRMVKRRYYLMEQAKLANIIGEHRSALPLNVCRPRRILGGRPTAS